MTIGKTIYLTRWAFVSKVMSLLFNMLSSLVKTFLPRSKRLFTFMAAVIICSDLGAPQNKVCHCFQCFLIIFHKMMGLDGILVCECWVLSNIFTLLFHSHQEGPQLLFTFCHKGGTYLWLLIFLPEILIPACASSSPASCMIYSAYRVSLIAQLVKNPPAVQETPVQFLGREDPPEKG